MWTDGRTDGRNGASSRRQDLDLRRSLRPRGWSLWDVRSHERRGRFKCKILIENPEWILTRGHGSPVASAPSIPHRPTPSTRARHRFPEARIRFHRHLSLSVLKHSMSVYQQDRRDRICLSIHGHILVADRSPRNPTHRSVVPCCTYVCTCRRCGNVPLFFSPLPRLPHNNTLLLCSITFRCCCRWQCSCKNGRVTANV